MAVASTASSRMHFHGSSIKKECHSLTGNDWRRYQRRWQVWWQLKYLKAPSKRGLTLSIYSNDYEDNASKVNISIIIGARKGRDYFISY